MRFSLSLVLWGAVGLIAFPCWARTAEEVRARLKAADKEVAHGTVMYRVEYDKGPPLSSEELNRRLETQRRYCSQMGYDSRKTAESVAELRRFLLAWHGIDVITVGLAYLDRLHYKRKQYSVGSGEAVTIILRDGPNKAVVSNGQMLVDGRVDSSLPPLIELEAGPCFPMGRGLSRLRRPTVQNRKEGIVVSGTAPDGAFVRAILDPQRGYVARRIERYTRPDRCQVWVLERYRLVNNTVWIPSRVVQRPLPRARLFREIRHALLHADFRRPDPSEVTVSLDGLDITDKRMGKTIGFKKVPAGVRNLDDLLPYTRKVAEDLARVQAQFDREQAKRRRVQVLIGLLFGCTAAAAGVIAWRSYRGLRRAQGRV